MTHKCQQCGACCAEMNSPPFCGEKDPQLVALPPDIRADYEMGMKGRAFSGWPDGVPCFWLTDGGTCKYYDYRPSVCRDFDPRSRSCEGWRAAAAAKGGGA